MRNFIFLLIAFVFLNCKKDTNLVQPTTMGSELSGTWKLTKITWGFSQISVTGDKMPFQETLVFDTNNSKYTRTQNSKQIDASSFSVETNANKQLIINYLADNTYQIYSLTGTTLSLYERATKGSVIADGSTYFYEKQ